MKLTDTQAIKIIKENKATKPEIVKMRESSAVLYALINGDDFKETLIDKIEFIEGEKKAIAREKYSRNMQDFFERLFQPLENIFYATGGNRFYDIPDVATKMKFLKQIAHIKDSNTLNHWIQTTALELSHVDPNGVMFMEYTTKKRREVFPKYKNIKIIRNYRKKGQLLEWILFEPTKRKAPNNMNQRLWRIVDDTQDRIFIETGDSTFVKSTKDSFNHPFGEVPAIINSNIVKVDDERFRLSPIDIILGLSKEYARDQSIKTIYKFFQGMPIHWRYVTECEECKGLGKDSNKKNCTACDGRGYKQKSDVTDMVTLPTPGEGETVITPDIAGFISPDIETWTQYNDELGILERIAIITFWGTPLNSIETFGGRKTTTEILFNKQPIENRLNRYADYAEFVEWKMSSWVLNFIDTQKPKTENQIKITYGRNYVIEPSDTLLKRYSEAKTAQENDTILDELFRQYLQATYRTNPIEHQKNLVKSEVEPYLHQTLTAVNNIFGAMEAQRKVLFGKWWDTLEKDDYTKPVEVLEKEFDAWFEVNKVNIETEKNNE